MTVTADQVKPWNLQVENEDLVATLETLVERFGEDMAPYAVGLTQHLAAAFWRMQVDLIMLRLHSAALLLTHNTGTFSRTYTVWRWLGTITAWLGIWSVCSCSMHAQTLALLGTWSVWLQP